MTGPGRTAAAENGTTGNASIDAAERKATLPTASFLIVIWATAAAAGAAFAAGALLLGFGGAAAVNGLAGAGVVAGAASLVIFALRPWRPRALLNWPVVWVAASFVRLLATLAGTYLLYSATHLGGRSLWMAVALAYLAVMFGETRVYAMSMRRFAPPAPLAPGAAEASTPE